MLVKLRFRNYKSLKEFEISPGNLSVLVGANGAGKTNFADALDFVSEIFRHGLAVAVARKGGYENIAHRKIRRSKSALRVDLVADYDAAHGTHAYWRRMHKDTPVPVRVQYGFEFRADSQSIRADFRVKEEVLKIESADKTLTHIARGDGDERVQILPGVQNSDPDYLRLLFEVPDLGTSTKRGLRFSSTQLSIELFARMVPALEGLAQLMSSMRVYQFSPTMTREPGTPVPNPELERYGENLPAVVDLLIRNHREQWQEISSIMRRIIPGLEKIDVGYTHTRRLGLFFHESGIGRPWTVAEISDGTIQSLALLVALFDPRTTALVLEEPENSIHPWILRHILAACVSASARKQVFLTTHSPVVIDFVDPSDVWVIWRSSGESLINKLTNLDPDVLALWEDGSVGTFDYLDSGSLDQAIPPQLELPFKKE